MISGMLKWFIPVIISLFAQIKSDSRDEVCTTEGCLESARILSDSIDFTTNPCDDFYQFACGKWLKNNPLPPGDDLEDVINDVLQPVIERQSFDMFKANITSNSQTIQFVKRAYDSCVATDDRKKHKSESIRKVIQKLGGWPMLTPNWNSAIINITQLAVWSSKLLNTKGLMIVKISEVTLNPCIEQNEEVIMEDRKFYMDPTNYSTEIQAYKSLLLEYSRFMAADMLISINESAVLAEIERVFEFEKDLVTILEALQHQTSETKTMEELKYISPSINWIEFFEGVLPNDVYSAMYNGAQNFNASKIHIFPVYMQALNNLLVATDKRTLINWLVSSFVHRFAMFLDDRFSEAKQDFYGVGKMDRSNQTTVCVDIQLNLMLEAAGALYTRVYTTPEIIDDMVSMIDNVKEAFLGIIDQSNWLNDVMKGKIKEKSNVMKAVVGASALFFDDVELDNYFQHLPYDKTSYFDMTFSYLQVEHKHRLVIMESKWNRTRPYIINPMDMVIYYSMDRNTMVIPAASLHYPFYKYDWPGYVKYGIMGYTVGHELSHGFDTKGIEFNKDGQRKEWWDPNSKAIFLSKVDCFIDSYSKYHLTDLNLTVNGDLTKDENIADIEGLKLSLRAYEIHLNKTGLMEKPLPALNLTIQQSFFAVTSHFQCANASANFATKIITTDPHTIFHQRILGLLSNTKAFTKAYSCPTKSSMNPTTKCEIW